jgi:hypothetical protein
MAFPNPEIKNIEVEQSAGQFFNILFETGDADLIVDLVKIRVVYTGNVARTFYLDRFDAQTQAWAFKRLALEKVVYKVERDYVIADAEFGEKFPSLIDEIKEEVKEGNTAFDVYSKEA